MINRNTNFVRQHRFVTFFMVYFDVIKPLPEHSHPTCHLYSLLPSKLISIKSEEKQTNFPLSYGWFLMKAPRKIWQFFGGFLTKKSKVFNILVIKSFFLQNFGYFWPFFDLKKIIFEVFKNETFNIMLYFSFFMS